MRAESVPELAAINTDLNAISQRKHAWEQYQVAITLNNRGVAYGNQGDYAGVVALLRESLEMRRTVLGDEHSRVA
jgi:hypothetical protein